MESPFVCDLSALSAEQRSRHRELAGRLRSAVLGFTELPNGFAARFEPESALLLEIAEFVMLERLCCPFLGFALEAMAEVGPLVLRVTGREGVKPFLREEFGIPLEPGGG